MPLKRPAEWGSPNSAVRLIFAASVETYSQTLDTRRVGVLEEILEFYGSSANCFPKSKRSLVMQRTILLLSRDESLLATRGLILEKAGYRSISATESRLALPLAGQFQPSIAIVDHTFSPNEQQAFVESLQEAHPGIFVLIVRFGLLHAAQLLEECECCLSNQPGGPRVRIMEPDFTVSLGDAHISGVFSKVS